MFNFKGTSYKPDIFLKKNWKYLDKSKKDLYHKKISKDNILD